MEVTLRFVETETYLQCETLTLPLWLAVTGFIPSSVPQAASLALGSVQNLTELSGRSA